MYQNQTKAAIQTPRTPRTPRMNKESSTGVQSIIIAEKYILISESLVFQEDDRCERPFLILTM